MEHKTKEELLIKHCVPECSNNGVKNAMDEYSKQECISFAEWLDNENVTYRNSPEKGWYKSFQKIETHLNYGMLSTAYEFFTIEELYNLFIKDTE